jgi:hypothetical protein
MDGTANNYLAGNLFIGATNPNGWVAGVVNTRSLTGGTSAYGYIADATIQSDVTNTIGYFRSQSSTAAASFTLISLNHFIAAQATFGAGSSVTTQRGFWAQASLVGATTDIAFQGSIPSGTNNWNIYMDGTANNYMAGNLSIGTTTSLTTLQVSGDISIALDKGYGFIRSGIFVPVLKKYTSDDSLEINNINNSYISIKSNNTERVRVKSTGQMRFVPLAADPSGAEAGDVYYNSTTNKLKMYNGTAWETITSL